MDVTYDATDEFYWFWIGDGCGCLETIKECDMKNGGNGDGETEGKRACLED